MRQRGGNRLDHPFPKDGRAQQRAVDVLRSTAKLALIRSGLSVDEQVVVDGQVRLRDGTKVSIKERPGSTERENAPKAR